VSVFPKPSCEFAWHILSTSFWGTWQANNKCFKQIANVSQMFQWNHARIPLTTAPNPMPPPAPIPIAAAAPSPASVVNAKTPTGAATAPVAPSINPPIKALFRKKPPNFLLFCFRYFPSSTFKESLSVLMKSSVMTSCDGKASLTCTFNSLRSLLCWSSSVLSLT